MKVACIDTENPVVIYFDFWVTLFFSEPPKLEEPEEWKEEKLSTLELLVQTHNNNPVERVSLKKTPYFYNPVAVLIKTETLTFYKFFKLQRINDSLMIHAEPNNFSVAEFITVGFVLSFKMYCRQQG